MNRNIFCGTQANVNVDSLTTSKRCPDRRSCQDSECFTKKTGRIFSLEKECCCAVQGELGPTGPSGPIGLPGASGANGLPGATGPSGTCECDVENGNIDLVINSDLGLGVFQTNNLCYLRVQNEVSIVVNAELIVDISPINTNDTVEFQLGLPYSHDGKIGGCGSVLLDTGTILPLFISEGTFPNGVHCQFKATENIAANDRFTISLNAQYTRVVV